VGRGGERRTALVLGGGGTYGLVQAAYVQAAYERGFRPDVVVGTSVGSLNGAWVALHPERADELLPIWRDLDRIRVLQLNPLRLAKQLAQRRISICQNDIVPHLIERYVGDLRFEDTQVPFAAVATSLTRARKHVFDSGPLGTAVLASTAIPGVFEPVEVDGELFVDGGMSGGCDLVTALDLGATEMLAIDLTPPVNARRPKTALGVLRQSLAALSRSATDAMEACLREQYPLRMVTPDLSRHSPWRLDVTDEAVEHNLRLARAAITGAIDGDGQLIPGPRLVDVPSVAEPTAPRRWLPAVSSLLRRPAQRGVVDATPPSA